MFIQAHRGNSGHAPENTLAAFRSAIGATADGIECDIHLTRDGRFVVCHDDTIDRTSTGTGEIAAMDFEELRRHDFGAKFGEGTIETALSLGCRAIHPHFAGIDEDYMREARAAGLTVNAWTANKPGDILFCKNMGCDAVITDEPALARTLV